MEEEKSDSQGIYGIVYQRINQACSDLLEKLEIEMQGVLSEDLEQTRINKTSRALLQALLTLPENLFQESTHKTLSLPTPRENEIRYLPLDENDIKALYLKGNKGEFITYYLMLCAAYPEWSSQEILTMVKKIPFGHIPQHFNNFMLEQQATMPHDIFQQKLGYFSAFSKLFEYFI